MVRALGRVFPRRNGCLVPSSLLCPSFFIFYSSFTFRKFSSRTLSLLHTAAMPLRDPETDAMWDRFMEFQQAPTELDVESERL